MAVDQTIKYSIERDEEDNDESDSQEYEVRTFENESMTIAVINGLFPLTAENRVRMQKIQDLMIENSEEFSIDLIVDLGSTALDEE